MSPQFAAKKRLDRFEPIFTADQEKELVAYIPSLAEGLFAITLHDLAFQMADDNNISRFSNLNKIMAGKEWL
jgi:hypothetical protein